MRLQLKSGLRRLWRAEDALQIGLSQRRGTVLGGLTPADLPVLERLREGVDAALFNADDDGLDTSRRRELVRLLTEAGVLVGTGVVGQPTRQRLGPAAERLTPDAEIWSVVHPQVGDGWGLVASRASRHVVIAGAGRLGSTLAATLTAAGVGQITVSDLRRVTAADLIPGGASSPDLGRPREAAAMEAVERLGGQAGQLGSGLARWIEDKPDVVVLIEHSAANAVAAGQLLSADLPHLSVVIREDDVVVGPLVRPGGGPCLRCLDLHRGDRDPAWPTILAQLLGPATAGGQPEETALTVLAAGLVSLQTLAHLDGVTEPATVGATLEIELPDGLIARREWPAHPACGCHWPPEQSPFADAGTAAGNSPITLWPDDPSASTDRLAIASLADARGRHRPETMGL